MKTKEQITEEDTKSLCCQFLTQQLTELKKKIENMKEDEKGLPQCEGLGCHDDTVKERAVEKNRIIYDILDLINREIR